MVQVSSFATGHGIHLGNEVVEMAHLKLGDVLDVVVQDDGGILLKPAAAQGVSVESVEDLAKRLIAGNSELFRRLS